MMIPFSPAGYSHLTLSADDLFGTSEEQRAARDNSLRLLRERRRRKLSDAEKSSRKSSLSSGLANLAMSSHTLYPASYPPVLAGKQAAHLSTQIRDWSVAHGLAVRPAAAFVPKQNDPNMALATTAPVTLFPSAFPKSQYHEALMIQKEYNRLYAAVAGDEAWLGEVVEGLTSQNHYTTPDANEASPQLTIARLATIDDFIAKLWNIHLAVKKEGYAQDLSLGLFRSDYMIHLSPATEKPLPILRQVEFNTIAASFGGLASRVSSLHRFLMSTAAYPQEAASIINPESLPENHSISGLAGGLAHAHRAYGTSKSGHQTCIIFIVQGAEHNIFDQKHLEYALIAQKLNVFRLPFERVLEDTTLHPETRALIYTPPAFPERQYEVTTVYYRAGYAPSEYEEPRSEPGKQSHSNEQPWQARLHIERSAAIKCPSILTHLAGSKKVQQILATPDSPDLARFLPSHVTTERVRRTFAPMYPLDDSPAGQQARKLALDPDAARRYVLKPQREGGGNNIYRDKIPAFLASRDEKSWPQYVLMEMIETPTQRNVILRNGETMEGGVICELGCYGAVLWNGKGELLYNEEAGTLLRTKGDSSEEGGVAAGFGAVDSCVLVDV